VEYQRDGKDSVGLASRNWRLNQPSAHAVGTIDGSTSVVCEVAKGSDKKGIVRAMIFGTVGTEESIITDTSVEISIALSRTTGSNAFALIAFGSSPTIIANALISQRTFAVHTGVIAVQRNVSGSESVSDIDRRAGGKSNEHLWSAANSRWQ
jgi:hypothetical protein